MNRRTFYHIIFIFACLSIFLSACGSDKKPSPKKPEGPPRDHTPVVLTPQASGTVTYTAEGVVIDASNTSEGYIMVQYTGLNDLAKIQVTDPSGIVCTYNLTPGQYDTFPLTGGSGSYKADIFEHVEGDTYSVLFSQNFDASISDEFKPFLYPNQYVWFTADNQTVKKAEELVTDTYSDLEAIGNIYEYIIENISYDEPKAETVKTGYLPDVDETLSSSQGICFDYAAIMTAMTRSQRIPTKLEVGYSGDILHAWISTYVEEIGWVDDIIEFDGSSWELMDPTLGANNDSKSVGKYIGDGSQYTLKYTY